MRNILNVVFDILLLMAIVIAAVGHMLPWFRAEARPDRFGHIQFLDGRDFKIDPKQPPDERRRAEEEARRQLAIELMSFQAWHAFRSGIALAALALLVALSLLINWGTIIRRFLVLGMFGSCLMAILFITLSMTHYPITEWHRQYAGRLWTDAGFAVALAPACVAAALSLIRMIWTMPPVRPKAALAGLPDASPFEPASRTPERADKPELFAQRD